MFCHRDMEALLRWVHSFLYSNTAQVRKSPASQRNSRDVRARLPRHDPERPTSPERFPSDVIVPQRWDDASTDPEIDVEAQQHRYVQIRDMLFSKGLPYHLIAYIFQLAQDGLELSIERQVYAIYSNNANTKYLSTPQLESNHPRNFVLQVVVDIYSHDQGWSTDPHREWIGTYDGSHTWWDLTLDRPVLASHSDDRLAYPDDSSDSERNSVSTTAMYAEIHRTELCRNLHASDKFQLQTIVLSSDNPLIQDAQPGDVFSLWARTQYPAWMNFVSYARIRVCLCWDTCYPPSSHGSAWEV